MTHLMLRLHRRGKRKGFTLIELLVVIAIIGFMASITLASVTTARVKAREAIRNNNYHQIIIALSMYYNTFGHYPCKTGDDSSQANFLKPLVDNKFLPVTLRDPLNTNNYVFEYNSYKNKAGGPCGQIAELSYDREGSTCTAGSVDASAYSTPTHCHNFFPTPLPCNDPYWTHAYFFTGNCLQLVDSSPYEY